jgi:hypothetical protein
VSAVTKTQLIIQENFVTAKTVPQTPLVLCLSLCGLGISNTKDEDNIESEMAKITNISGVSGIAHPEKKIVIQTLKHHSLILL